MSRLLTVDGTIELLESLRAAVREFTAAEEKLTRDFRARSEAAEKRFAEELSTLEISAAARRSAEETAARNAIDSQRARQEQRKARITKAHKASLKTALERIENQEGRRKYQSQKGLLDTKRSRTDALAQNDAALAEFHHQLNENRGAFVDLEEKARSAFRGYPGLRRKVDGADPSPNTNIAGDEHQLLEQLRQLQARAAENLGRFNQLTLAKIFRTVPLWLWLVLIVVCAAAAVPGLKALGQNIPLPVIGGAAAGLIVLVLVGYFVGRGKAASLGTTLANELETARRLHNAALEKSQQRHDQEIQRIEAEAATRTESLNENWRTAKQEAEEARGIWPGRIEEKGRRAAGRHEQSARARLEGLEQGNRSTLARLDEETATSRRQITAANETRVASFTSEYKAQWQKLEADWKRVIEPLYEQINAARLVADQKFPPWKPELWAKWAPPATFENAARFGQLEVDLKRFSEGAPQDPRLSFPWSGHG